MADNKYDPKLDQVVFVEDCLDEKMRVECHVYNGGTPKFKLVPIYMNKQGVICVETNLTASGRYVEKQINRITCKQINRLYHLTQQKIQDGVI